MYSIDIDALKSMKYLKLNYFWFKSMLPDCSPMIESRYFTTWKYKFNWYPSTSGSSRSANYSSLDQSLNHMGIQTFCPIFAKW